MAHKFAKTFGVASVGGVVGFGVMQFINNQNDHLVLFSKKSGLKVEQPKSDGIMVSKCLEKTVAFDTVVDRCVKRLNLWKTTNCTPGYVLGVSVRGKNVWLYSDGFADIENGVPCKPDTVMRIASISKSITAALLMKMVQENKINLDKDISEYLTPEQFPVKKWENEPVKITLRQLASHLGGIRNYKKSNGNEEEEFYSNVHYKNTVDGLSMFKDDPLVSKPGTKFEYTTFGWTLISAVMETQMVKKDFSKGLLEFLHKDLGLSNTILDENDPIVYNRARYYCINKKTGKIKNVSYVDNSYKYAGGGLLSNISDLLSFGNMMLYSYKGADPIGRKGFLEQEIVDEMWKPAPNSNKDKNFGGYGIGWNVVRDFKVEKAFTADPGFETIISHTGGAVGATSVLLIEPKNEMVIAIITNLQETSGIYQTALDIALQFSSEISKQNKKEKSTLQHEN